MKIALNILFSLISLSVQTQYMQFQFTESDDKEQEEEERSSLCEQQEQQQKAFRRNESLTALVSVSVDREELEIRRD